MPQVGQRRSLADFFLAGMAVVSCMRQRVKRLIGSREGRGSKQRVAANLWLISLKRAGEDSGDDVVVVGLGDLGAVEAAGFEGFESRRSR